VKKKIKNHKVQPFSIKQQIPFLKELNSKDKLSIFLGAGISVSCGLPDWSALINSLKEEVELQNVRFDDGEDIANVARSIFDYKFNSVVAYCLYKNELAISDSALAIANSGVRNIVNFNFDDILEEIYQSECIDHVVVLSGEKFNLNNDHITIFHPHGYLGRFDSEYEHSESNIVLSKSDYESLYKNHYCLTNLIQLSMLMTKTVLFVGMSMTDPNIIRLLKKSREVGVRSWHYALMKIETQEKKEKETKRLRNIGVDPVWYRDHSEIPTIIKKIRK